MYGRYMALVYGQSRTGCACHYVGFARGVWADIQSEPGVTQGVDDHKWQPARVESTKVLVLHPQPAAALCLKVVSCGLCGREGGGDASIAQEEPGFVVIVVDLYTLACWAWLVGTVAVHC